MEEQSQGQQHHPPSQLQDHRHGESHFPNFSKLTPLVVWATNTARAKWCCFACRNGEFQKEKGLGDAFELPLPVGDDQQRQSHISKPDVCQQHSHQNLGELPKVGRALCDCPGPDTGRKCLCVAAVSTILLHLCVSDFVQGPRIPGEGISGICGAKGCVSYPKSQNRSQ